MLSLYPWQTVLQAVGGSTETMHINERAAVAVSALICLLFISVHYRLPLFSLPGRLCSRPAGTTSSSWTALWSPASRRVCGWLRRCCLSLSSLGSFVCNSYEDARKREPRLATSTGSILHTCVSQAHSNRIPHPRNSHSRRRISSRRDNHIPLLVVCATRALILSAGGGRKAGSCGCDAGGG